MEYLWSPDDFQNKKNYFVCNINNEIFAMAKEKQGVCWDAETGFLILDDIHATNG
jgi:hypothetical protein